MIQRIDTENDIRTDIENKPDNTLTNLDIFKPYFTQDIIGIITLLLKRK